jgi:uncharacterized protein (TIRG00374 family)
LEKTVPSPGPSSKHRLAVRVLVGLLLLGGLIVLVVNRGEIDRFAEMASRAKPAWLIVGLLLQAGTYFCVAIAWMLALRNVDVDFPLLPLVPLSVAKLFSDQVMPSGGISGTAFVIGALSRRGVSAGSSMAAFIVNIVGYYAAYILAALASLVLLVYYHDIHAWILTAAFLFFIVAVVVPAGVLLLRRWSSRPLPSFLMRSPAISYMVQAFGSVPPSVVSNPRLIAKVSLLETAVFLLDSATLWVMLLAVGQEASLLEAIPSLVVASMVATIGPIPLGLGAFEATCVGMLGSLGIPFEAALTSTLLFRGLTLWLPMVPGMWLARRELSQQPRSGA